ncbi:hypothetical protein DFA_02284 [Cavenderia fasciculata]|uniref:Copper transport protein n=1 Tax=Cavenderia fasciculata TaxID=261658 RepID=F4PZ12_CACFS|nr:uncharacterized protein DFA_02284 [Cavenderia fasciculata]EGG19041.1 hypothetical protein DFA_02284 [Cavenderia fasciculata]|eukprot:XP_004366674.1 hypothetical protein DFA_02284 [Cavenderia fasciculata]
MKLTNPFSLTICILLATIFNNNNILSVDAQVNCIATPNDSSCVNYQYPVSNVTQDINGLCMDMDFMPLCSVQKECNSIDSQTGVCYPFSILADGCQYDMPGMKDCSNYNQLCSNTSVVKECTERQAIAGLPKTTQLSQYIYSICTSMSMDACSQCTIPATSSSMITTCDLLSVYTSLCQQMPDMSECASWKTMCQNGAVLGSSVLSEAYCEAPIGEQIPLMRMFFHTGILDYILFETWVPRSKGQFAGYWFLIFFGAIVFECEKTLRSILEKRWEAEKQRQKDLTMSDSTPTDTVSISQGFFKGDYPKFNPKIDILRGFLHGFELTLSYLLMLVAMTFNVALFFAVIAGTVVGNILVGRYRSFKPKVTCCD